MLLISVDGLHQQDLAWYVRTHPHSVLAALARRGVEYRNAVTPFPSDSFPGLVGQVTGGDPRATGIYYDDTWNHAVFPAGTTSCTGPVPGGEVSYTEAADLDQSRLDAGQGLTGLPGSILRMTGDPLTVINPAALPVDPRTCRPIDPNRYLKVNTIFNVARAHGLRTAWSDKHPAYQVLSGPSGTGVPAIFGMNFQAVSTAEKLPSSDGLTGGYLPGGRVPGPLLTRALNYVDGKVGLMVAQLRRQGLAGSTAIIISAKHGQSPTDPNALARVPDGPVIDAINAAWRKAHPGAADLVVFAVDDDGMLMWLSDRSQAAAGFAAHYLMTHPAAGNNAAGQPVTVKASGLKAVYPGAASARFFGVPASDPRHPDVLGVAQHGVVYTGGMGKIAEHGGDDPQDRNVPILVVAPTVAHGRQVGAPVETTQIAPTILALLGLSPGELQAVRIEHTKVLPGLAAGAGH